MSELLAKSSQNGRELSLLQHTLDVMDTAENMYGTVAGGPTHLGSAWLRFFKIEERRWPAFHANLLASAGFHDWGKANDGMQAVLHRRPGEQVMRHEHLSALMLALDGVVPWLQPRGDVDWDLVLSAVLTHHLKAGCKDLDAPPLRKTKQFRLLNHIPEFKDDLVGLLTQRLGLAKTPPKFPTSPLWSFNEGGTKVSIVQKREELQDRRLRRFQEALRKPDGQARQRMLWAVRAALIAADAAASGLFRVETNIRAWIQTNFTHAALCDRAFIEKEIIQKRIDELKGKNKWKDWTDFQKHCDDLSERALLLAPCGSGKTLAAWRWIAAQVAKRSVARVIFLYPTRATAKEGFRDYVSWAPESHAALMHGTADYDLQDMFTNAEDPRHGYDYETDRRLYALRFWTRRIFSATVDQFLAFLHYGYGPVCLLPLLADSVVVIDEVHSFDRSMFSGLKGFLRTFDVPVLCMTATLPNDRRDDLAACGLQVCDEKPGELRGIAEAPRYVLHRVDEREAIDCIRKALSEGQRVLWVVNQVKRAQRAAQLMACDFSAANRNQDCLHVTPGVPLFCYHSRFLLRDRVKRHNQVVGAFRDDSPPALAITTQVCEMSLDMDADLLVTEECPITALIQRMGRCNRARTPRKGAGTVLVYRPLDDRGKPDCKPYDSDALTGLEAFLNDLSDRTFLNQSDLEVALIRAPLPPSKGDKASNFLESGPYALGGEDEFRDIEEFSISAVLNRDLEDFLKMQQAKKPTDGLIVPVPRRLGKERDPRLPSHLAVGATEHYHAAIGFCDKPLAGGNEL